MIPMYKPSIVKRTVTISSVMPFYCLFSMRIVFVCKIEASIVKLSANKWKTLFFFCKTTLRKKCYESLIICFVWYAKLSLHLKKPKIVRKTYKLAFFLVSVCLTKPQKGSNNIAFFFERKKNNSNQWKLRFLFDTTLY